MAIGKCNSCNKQVKLPDPGKKYRCKCGGAIAAMGEVKQSVQEESGTGGEKKSSLKNSYRFSKTRAEAYAKQRNRKLIFSAGGLVVIVCAIVFAVSLTKADPLDVVAANFVKTWNETGGEQDKEGLLKTVAFFLDQNKYIKNLPTRFFRYKWFLSKPVMDDPMFPANYNDDMYESYPLEFVLSCGDQRVKQKIFWRRDNRDEWRIESMPLLPELASLDMTAHQFQQTWNEARNSNEAVQVMPLFVSKRERTSIKNGMKSLFKKMKWSTSPPELGAAQASAITTSKKSKDEKEIDFVVKGNDNKELIKTCWKKKNDLWYLGKVDLVSRKEILMAKGGDALNKEMVLKQEFSSGDKMTYKMTFQSAKGKEMIDEIWSDAFLEIEVEDAEKESAALVVNVSRIQGKGMDAMNKKYFEFDTDKDRKDSQIVAQFATLMAETEFSLEIDSLGMVVNAYGVEAAIEKMEKKRTELLTRSNPLFKDLSIGKQEEIKRKVNKFVDEFSGAISSFCMSFPLLPSKPVKTGGVWNLKRELALLPDQRHIVTSEGELGTVQDGIVNANFTGSVKNKNQAEINKKGAFAQLEDGKIKGCICFDLKNKVIKRRVFETAAVLNVMDKKTKVNKKYTLELVAHHKK